MISQFSLGLYMTVHVAMAGCEFVIGRPPKLLPNPCFSVTDPTGPTSGLYDMHPCGKVAYGNRIHYLGSRIWYGTSLALYRSSRRHPLRSPHRPSCLLGHRLSRGTVQSNQGSDTRSIEDYGSRRDVLFPGHIHFTSRGPDVSLFRKRKRVVIIYHSLSHTFIGTNKVTPCLVSDPGVCVPFVRSPEFFPHNSGNLVYVRTLLCFLKYRV